MSIPFSQAKLKAEERRAILQAIETQMQQVIIDGVTQVLQEFLEQEVTFKLGRPKRSPRRMSSQAFVRLRRNSASKKKMHETSSAPPTGLRTIGKARERPAPQSAAPRYRDRLHGKRRLEVRFRERLPAVLERLVQRELVAQVRRLVSQVRPGECRRRNDDLAAHRLAELGDEVEGAAILALHHGGPEERADRAQVPVALEEGRHPPPALGHAVGVPHDGDGLGRRAHRRGASREEGDQRDQERRSRHLDGLARHARHGF